MSNRLVGYLIGVDPLLLTSLEVDGFDTIPISNGYDGHGKSIQLLSPSDEVVLIISYFHKLMPPLSMNLEIRDILYRSTTYNIPILTICPAELTEKAKALCDDWPENVEFVDPANVLTRAKKILAAANAHS